MQSTNIQVTISSLDVKNKENEVRILELEVQKHELENRLTQLKADRFIDGEYIDLQEELDECHETIKQQNQTLLHISAELDAIKQYDPFDSVLITGSIENIFNIIEGRTEPIIDEGCVGCCRVQRDTELIERLGTEIHNRDKTIKDFKAIETKETDRLHEIILDMDVTISDLMDNDRKINGFLDEYRVTVDNRDKTIEELKDRNIEDLHELYDLYEEELRGIKADRTSIKLDRDIMFQNYRNTVAKLQGDIGVLEAELTEKQEIIDKITNLRVNEVETLYNLKAELSVRKEDSAMLMKVVEIVKRDDNCPTIINQLADLLVDCLDAPEGPPETPINDLYKVTVAYTLLEVFDHVYHGTKIDSEE